MGIVMAIGLNTSLMNLQSIMGNRTDLQKSLARMASGRRINNAAGGPAELAAAIKMQSEQLSNMQAQRNAHDGLSMIQTAEGAANSAGESLARMRELSVQAASGTINDEQRAMIQTEITGIQAEMDRIAGVTEFNGVQLSDGSNPALTVQVGTGADPDENTIKVKLGDLRSSSLGVGAATVNVSSSIGALSALDAIDSAMQTLNSQRSGYGAAHNRMNASVNILETGFVASVEAESRIMDTDYAFETAEAAKSQMLMDMGLAAAGQANKLNQNLSRGLLAF